MTTVIAIPHAEPHSEAERLHRVRINRLGLWLFFLSDSLLFALFAAARFYMVGTSRPHVDQTLGLAITSLLLLSSLTAYRAETAFEHNNLRHGRAMLLATVVMGLLFLSGVAFEWSEAEFSRKEAYGTAFFSMTGMHAFHVATGVFFLALIWVRSRGGRFLGGAATWPVSGVVMYWHFVDVVWVFFYPALYLVK
ncbi:MAG: heme-copper oxidase subunit III [Dehalococcoidia bacterium]|nr:MAG: heme-copper oxidase subunit III [Dehalococcoidia bacterium]